jgi:peroxiredoxin
MTALDFSDVDFSKLPRPADDGAADHLNRTRLPNISLSATTGNVVDLSTLSGRTIVYIYPKTGVPGVPMPEGWDMIPGARGCSPQSCGFRDHFFELKSLGVSHLFGMSSQTSDYQREAAARLHLPFELLSDQRFELTDVL